MDRPPPTRTPPLARHAFRAPWGPALGVSTVLAVGLLVVVSWFVQSAAPDEAATWVGLMPILILGGVLPFLVRGYTVTPHEIRVIRPLWQDRLPRAGLVAVAADPTAMRGSVRLFGNGGLFAITGIFRNAALGRYRAFVNDPRRAVVLRWPDRTVVLAPDDPQRFVAVLGERPVRDGAWGEPPR